MASLSIYGSSGRSRCEGAAVRGLLYDLRL